jgi:hypothetical protein
MSGHGGYGYAAASDDGGSLYTREVVRSHPANYSQMIARHDLRAGGHTPPRATAGGEGREHGGGGPNC